MRALRKHGILLLMPKTPSRDDSRKSAAPAGRTARPAPARASSTRPATAASSSRRAPASQREGGKEDSRATFLEKVLAPPDAAERAARSSVAERREQARRAARKRPEGASSKS